MNFSIRVIFVLMSAYFVSCENGIKEEDTKSQLNGKTAFISPAFSTFNIEFENRSINAAFGDTLSFASGSKVIFPKNSLVDKNGNLISGKVEVKFREFKDPLDFFIAGVPMQYDSANTDYTLESAGMCEILVSQKGEEVFVNQSAQPIISLSSKDADPNHNLYFLNEATKNWENRGKSKIEKKTSSNSDEALESVEVREFGGKRQEIALITDKVLKIKKPIKPIEALGDRPVFFVSIPDVDFIPELKIFKNTMFELHESEKNYSEKDAEVEWESVEIDSTKTKGVYRITFKLDKKTASYKVRPVYDGEYYENALAIFKTNENKYIAEKKALDIKMAEEAAREEEIFLAEMKAWNEAEEKRQAEYASRMKTEFSENMATGGDNMKFEIDRVFRINQFGYWNCDQRVLARAKSVFANFINEKGEKLYLNNVSLVYKKYNSVFVFNDFGKLKIIPTSKTMMWSVVNDKLAYMTYADFDNYSNIYNSTKAVDFTLRVTEEAIKTREELETLLNMGGNS